MTEHILALTWQLGTAHTIRRYPEKWIVTKTLITLWRIKNLAFPLTLTDEWQWVIGMAHQRPRPNVVAVEEAARRATGRKQRTGGHQKLSELGIKNYTVAELRERKWPSIAAEFQTWIDQIDILYISFDVDSMDPDLTSYGTGTPVKDGITPEEANDMLTFFAKQEKLCCLEFVEVNPCLDDKKNKMAEVTFDLVKEAVKTMTK